MGELNLRGQLGSGGGSSSSIQDAVITLASNSFIYDGTEKTQAVASVTLYGETLTDGVDYLVQDNTAISAGTHTLSVLGIREYSGLPAIPGMLQA